MQTLQKPSIAQKVKQRLFTSFQMVTIIGLASIIFEEALPEPLAKPIVVTTVLASIGLHLYAWKRSRKWLPSTGRILDIIGKYGRSFD